MPQSSSAGQRTPLPLHLLRPSAIIPKSLNEVKWKNYEPTDGYALSMMGKQTFTKKDLLKEIGSLRRLS